MAENQMERFEGWCILELMGHSRTAGFVRTVELAGHGMLRVDVFCDDSESSDRTEYFSPGALYALRPVSEELARYTASELGRPITHYGLESVFKRMSLSQLEHWTENVATLIKSRQLSEGKPEELPIELDPRSVEDDYEDRPF